jgi:hypothetical protein
VASRLIDHAPNVTPIVGLSLFAGSISHKFGWIVPVSIFAISNCWLGHYEVALGLIVYGSFILPALLGRFAKTTFYAVGLSSLSAVSFFVVSNFAVWINSGMYEHSLQGLITCYTLAIPFFQNSLVSAVASSGVIFGLASLFSMEYNINDNSRKLYELRIERTPEEFDLEIWNYQRKSKEVGCNRV